MPIGFQHFKGANGATGRVQVAVGVEYFESRLPHSVYIHAALVTGNGDASALLQDRLGDAYAGGVCGYSCVCHGRKPFRGPEVGGSQ